MKANGAPTRFQSPRVSFVARDTSCSTRLLDLSCRRPKSPNQWCDRAGISRASPNIEMPSSRSQALSTSWESDESGAVIVQAGRTVCYRDSARRWGIVVGGSNSGSVALGASSAGSLPSDDCSAPYGCGLSFAAAGDVVAVLRLGV